MEHPSLSRAELGTAILDRCRDELTLRLPYLDAALAAMQPCPDPAVQTIGADGRTIRFSPAWITALYARNPDAATRGYLHLLVHWLYLHPFRRDSDPELWSIACDMAAEACIERLALPGMAPAADPVRRRCLDLMDGRPAGPAALCAALKAGRFPFSLPALQSAFLFDDHSLWSALPPAETRQELEKWSSRAAGAGLSRGGRRGQAGTQAGGDAEEVGPIRAGRYDYRRFLRRFMTPREEVELDPDSFDYVLYCFGLTHYGNLPLIEPLEYREVNRLSELVIAIDTSGSCSRETVRRFLEETYAIISRRENFFRRMEVHLLQCDCCIQDAAVLRSEEDWKRYVRGLQIRGRGGTDFRPVFQYIARQREQHRLRRLGALIYFSDGDGIYPREKPDYETAFVFLEQSAKMDFAPPWITRLIAK